MPLAWVEEAVPEAVEPLWSPFCSGCNGIGTRLEVDRGDWSVRHPVVCFHCGGTGLAVELGGEG